MNIMKKNKDEILKTLKNIKNDINRRYRVKIIDLFGSFVNNRQKNTSDIDFLVEFEEDTDLFRLIGFSHHLEEIFHTRVDVISKPSQKKDLKQHILQEVKYE